MSADIWSVNYASVCVCACTLECFLSLWALCGYRCSGLLCLTFFCLARFSVCVCVHLSLSIWVCVFVQMRVCVCVWMHACMWVFISQIYVCFHVFECLGFAQNTIAV